MDTDIVIDTREQQPWYFPDFNCINTSLKTGDYSIKGYEDIFCIERKGCVTEVAGNVIQKRFENELERMSSVRHSYILCEFSLINVLDYPVGTNIPHKKWRNLKVTGKFILGKLMRYQIRYGVHILFCDNREMANFTANNLIRYISEYYDKKTG